MRRAQEHGTSASTVFTRHGRNTAGGASADNSRRHVDPALERALFGDLDFTGMVLPPSLDHLLKSWTAPSMAFENCPKRSAYEKLRRVIIHNA